jgi:multicomponent Na+:H+ antiporter subunit E
VPRSIKADVIPLLNMSRLISLFAVLFLFWVVLSGFFTPFLLGAGVLCALAVAWLANRMDVVDHEGHPIHLGPRLFTYWPWLFVEIVKSAWMVSKIILDPKLPISPTMVKFTPGQRTVVGLVTHANSITLTPATISIEVAPGEFVVHGLTRENALACIDSEMDRQVQRFEGQRAVKDAA